MTAGTKLPSISVVPTRGAPRLEPGDHLTREEFERRYDADPTLKKLGVYRRNGVREYIVWRVQDRKIDWFILRHGQFEPLLADAEGITRSETFPGFWLKSDALVGGGSAELLRVLQLGISSPEHANFMSLLKSRSASSPNRD